MEQNKPEYHVVSLSGGKDSTAMLLMMLECGMQIDCILFCDTGLEFPGLYAHLEKLEQYNKHAEPWRVTVVDTGLNTMTGGRIKRVREYIGNEPFLLT